MVVGDRFLSDASRCQAILDQLADEAASPGQQPSSSPGLTKRA